MRFFSFSGDFEIQQFINFCRWIEVNTKSFWRINWHSTTECWLKWQIHWQTYKWIASILSITWSCKETLKGDLRMGSWKWIYSLSSHYFQRSSLLVSKKFESLIFKLCSKRKIHADITWLLWQDATVSTVQMTGH